MLYAHGTLQVMQGRAQPVFAALLRRIIALLRRL